MVAATPFETTGQSGKPSDATPEPARDFAAEVVRDLPMTSWEAFELAEVVVREIYTIKSGRGSSISA